MKRLLQDEKVRYILAGGSAAGINWLVRFPLSEFLPYPVAVTLATMIGMVFGFFSYKYLVFGPTSRPLWAQIRDFIGVNLVAAIVTVIAAVAVRDLPPWPAGWLAHVEAAAHAFGIAVAAVVNYFGHRHVTFNDH